MNNVLNPNNLTQQYNPNNFPHQHNPNNFTQQPALNTNHFTQLPILFPDNLDSKFEEYIPTNAIPFRDLPTGDYKITSDRKFKTKDSRDCMILSLISKDQTSYSVFAPDRLRDELVSKPDTFNYLRNLGLKPSKTSENQYFDYRLA